MYWRRISSDDLSIRCLRTLGLHTLIESLMPADSPGRIHLSILVLAGCQKTNNEDPEPQP